MRQYTHLDAVRLGHPDGWLFIREGRFREPRLVLRDGAETDSTAAPEVEDQPSVPGEDTEDDSVPGEDASAPMEDTTFSADFMRGWLTGFNDAELITLREILEEEEERRQRAAATAAADAMRAAAEPEPPM